MKTYTVDLTLSIDAMSEESADNKLDAFLSALDLKKNEKIELVSCGDLSEAGASDSDEDDEDWDMDYDDIDWDDDEEDAESDDKEDAEESDEPEAEDEPEAQDEPEEEDTLGAILNDINSDKGEDTPEESDTEDSEEDWEDWDDWEQAFQVTPTPVR